ncbi:heme oxygenase (biliverdin-producing) [Gordonia soli]|uniref:Heme oxygenase n=1 Tax=Gordonia soli NBRC 108243 TaxID=1223545 RepID=M0QLP7_9ACTN|nr:biliverdin-producing heme oxygenase [Gordonia soli]GAC69483.1 heme oxygenase [Gordonia soli NBRC 108243]
MTTSAESTSISAGLRAATAVAHERAESATFVDDLLSGRADLDACRQLPGQLYFVYQALETTGDALATDPIAGAVVDERLRRVPALLADLAALGVDPDALRPLPAVARYAAAIESTRDDPARFVAHHYTRYLGDLSGGQVVAHRMRLHYGLGDDAVNFYRFDGIDKLKRYKDSYRDRLDALDIDDAARDRLLAEAVRAFEYNEAMFADLSVGESRPA